MNVVEGDRFRELDRRQQYFECTQHDWKRFDFDGRLVRPGPPTMQPLLSSEASSWYVPLRLRRPSAPYRLAKRIVRAFTNLLFGNKRFPGLLAPGDFAAQDYAQALVKASRLPLKMVRARDIGGSTGTAGLSWCFYNGMPRVEVHNPKHLFVHEWEDRDELIPAHVTEVYRFWKDAWDPQKKAVLRKWFWFRRDWTPDADIVFEEVEYVAGVPPMFVVDPKRSVQHGDDECHFVWIQNLPNDEIDGLPDYDGLYENFDTLDMLYSVLVRGTTLNLDPTLVLKIDKMLQDNEKMKVKKGSDNALLLNKDESAEYMELGGSAATTGLAVFASKRQSILEVAECIIIDPDKVAAQGLSAVAIEAMYEPMLAKAGTGREMYGDGINRIVDMMMRSARKHHGSKVTVVNEDLSEEDGEEFINLPPRPEKVVVPDAQGNPVEETKMVERHPGQAETLDVEWPPWFRPTPDDRQKEVTLHQNAAGNVPILSQQSAVEKVSTVLGLDPAVEWKRVQEAQKAAQADQRAMMGGGEGIGGEVSNMNELPPDATPREQKPIEGAEDAPGQGNPEAEPEEEGVDGTPQG